MGLVWREMPVPRAFFYISPGVFSKKKVILIKQTSLVSKSSVKEPPIQGTLAGYI
jgi:hypothetical protein